MAELIPKDAAHINTSAGHLSVHVEGAHPPEIKFSFEREPKRLTFSIVTSVILDILIVTLLVLASRYRPAAAAVAVLPDAPNKEIIWLSEPGPGGGGGGGGNKMKDPPRKAELPGKDKITVPVEKPPKLEPPQQVTKEPNPIEQLNIPAKELAAAQDSLPGAIEAPPGPPTLSQGSGSGGGAGTGSGSGIGPGSGSGLGPGSGGGTGGGAYRPGNGVSTPVVLREVKPQYTSDAMRAKVQGSVLLECIVRPDGTVGDVKVARSLDPVFGLDLEAMKAARQWRFRPGMRQGEPVAVLVVIELTFTLR
jgi:periplasmic protein TonB